VKVYEQSWDIFNNREHRFIQKYGSNEEGAIKANQHIDQQMGKTTKRIGEFFKKRVEKWSMDKKRVDQNKAETPHKCLDILVRPQLLRTKLAGPPSARRCRCSARPQWTGTTQCSATSQPSAPTTR
jgi:hypothetical protein